MQTFKAEENLYLLKIVLCKKYLFLNVHVNNYLRSVYVNCIIYSIEKTFVHLMFVVLAIHELLYMNFCRFTVDIHQSF